MPGQTETRHEPSPQAVPPAAPGAQPAGTVDWSKPRVAAILRAAVKCFARSGFDTTTAEIAAEIGIPKSVIYHYFDDKTTLVREAQRFAYAEHLKRVREAISKIREESNGSFIEMMRGIWQLREARDIGFQVGIWSELRNDERVREQAVQLRQEHHRMVADGLLRALGIEGGDPSRTEPLSSLVLAALTGLSINTFVEGDDKHTKEAHQLFLSLVEKGIERFGKRPDSELPPPSMESELPPPYEAVRVPPSQKGV